MDMNEIFSGNRLIDAFMDKDAPHSNCGRTWTIQYERSWDVLMPVWIKFRNLNIKGEEYDKWLDALGWYLYNSNEPGSFFERLVQAIKWLNSQPVKP